MCPIAHRVRLNANLSASIQAAHDSGAAPYTPVTPEDG